MIEDIIRKNKRLIDQLNETIDAGALFHAYIIQSKDAQVRMTLANHFIKALLCHVHIGVEYPDKRICGKVDGEKHEDLQVIRPEKRKSVSIEQIRNMQKRLMIKPFGERNIVLIEAGDQINDIAQNGLLKTLEEPPGDTIIMILCENAENLIPTVRSRCNILYINEDESVRSEEIREKAREFINLAGDGAAYYRLKALIDDLDKSDDDVYSFIDISEEICHERLFMRDDKGMPFEHEKTGRAIGALEEARRKLERGLTRRYVMKDLLLKIGG